ncbi:MULTISPECIES: quinone-dependent dihydroorotate dehydrogenase [unclassified Pseudoclavibacter]|uniref:quinone-dependent dihydroorotate dehydrogenase n=1 Tax=unclassified Pseudoclavibacter TaxID=2615177 RepID=UPI001BA91B4B|nr:quinone-dependent dihydroorotate dehydrogenase [Pseudoclavibacter sp. Marseille-Q4354]MBS3178093.1 quinone-dependent dihydroorotate dehydrogenase [Pseudoclavibacter sp. Marseille-Q4354]
MNAAYRLLFRHVLSKMDPERAHALASGVIRALGRRGPAAFLSPLAAPAESLRVETMGLSFASPFGLAAGFDKDAEDIDGLATLGFGHVEVGTVTPRPQPGNPGPRLFRLVADGALINRMGFNNRGAELAAANIAARRNRSVIVGVNIGKNKTTEADDAHLDYAAAAAAVKDVADYLVVNVSSPNTPGLRRLQSLGSLTPILRAARDAAPGVPLLVKIAPDLDDEEIREVTQLAIDEGLAGIIAANTTISRSGLRTSARIVEAFGAGGLSGRPLTDRSLEVLRIVKEASGDRLCIISVGGVADAAEVRRRLDAGATLVQGYTEFLYAGPMWAASINRGLARRAR